MRQVTVDVVEILPEKGLIGKKYRKDAKPLMDWLAGLTKQDIEQLEKQLTDNGYAVCGRSIHMHMVM